jgi:branched-chain amino acid transport system ATP-binding protein
MTEMLLEVNGLHAGYGHAQVLREIGLRVEPATITAVLGANGAGKTTLLRTLSGLLQPSAGTISYRGASLVGVPVERRVTIGIAHVPEGRGVIAELTVEENLRLGGLWRKGSQARITADAIAEVYEVFEPLIVRRKHKGHQLSGGERQMLALGRALVARPSLLLLDEPSLGLAPTMVSRILALVRTLKDKTGLTVLLVEQNVQSALAIADQGLVLALGRIVASGPAAELLADDHLRHSYLGF